VHVTLTVGRHFRGLASTKFGVPNELYGLSSERYHDQRPIDNLTALRRPKYRQNGKRLPGTEMRAIECACCESCAGNQGKVMEDGGEDMTTGRREMKEHACMLQDATVTPVCARLRRRRMLRRVVLLE
jgi:hypothetical protein